MKLFIAGHTGMVGSALTRRFSLEPGVSLVLRDIRELDMTDQASVDAFYAAEKPEAAIIAAWLLESAPELAQETAAWTVADSPAVPPCPFLRRSGKGARCAIYPVRPLVCRLFGASGTRDREGHASFRLCAHMPLAGFPPVGGERPSITGPRLEERFGSPPPAMAVYAAELAALSPSEAAERSLIVDARPSAWARVSLSLSLADGRCDRTYSA